MRKGRALGQIQGKAPVVKTLRSELRKRDLGLVVGQLCTIRGLVIAKYRRSHLATMSPPFRPLGFHVLLALCVYREALEFLDALLVRLLRLPIPLPVHHRLAYQSSPPSKQCVILRPFSMIPKILLLVEQVRPRASQIDDLRTAIPVLLQSRALETVESVTDPFPTAHHALVLIVAERAFVADSDESCWADVAVADGAFAVTFVAETADCYAWLLAAHDEIAMDMMLARVMNRHSGSLHLRVMARHIS